MVCLFGYSNKASLHRKEACLASVTVGFEALTHGL